MNRTLRCAGPPMHFRFEPAPPFSSRRKPSHSPVFNCAAKDVRPERVRPPFLRPPQPPAAAAGRGAAAAAGLRGRRPGSGPPPVTPPRESAGAAGAGIRRCARGGGRGGPATASRGAAGHGPALTRVSLLSHSSGTTPETPLELWSSAGDRAEPPALPSPTNRSHPAATVLPPTGVSSLPLMLCTG